MAFDDLPGDAIVELLALKDTARVDLVFGLSRHQFHGQQEFQRDEADFLNADARFASARPRLLDGVVEERGEVESAVDQIDAKSSLAVAHADAVDPQGPDLGGRSTQRLGRFLGGSNGDGEAGVLRRPRNASGLQCETSNQREVGALFSQRG